MHTAAIQAAASQSPNWNGLMVMLAVLAALVLAYLLLVWRIRHPLPGVFVLAKVRGSRWTIVIKHDMRWLSVENYADDEQISSMNMVTTLFYPSPTGRGRLP